MVKVNDLVWVNGRRGRVTVGPYLGPDQWSDQPTHYVQVELEGVDTHPHEYLASEVFRDGTLYDGMK